MRRNGNMRKAGVCQAMLPTSESLTDGLRCPLLLEVQTDPMRFPPLFEELTGPGSVPVEEYADRLRIRRFGVIQVCQGRLQSVRLRPWPARFTLLEAVWHARFLHRRRGGDRCLLYYNQPWGSPDYLALQYLVSHRDTTIRSLRTALGFLDQIARLKASAAIVCQVSNCRLTDRMLRREGWEPHLPGTGRRHFIKRFSGQAAGNATGRFSGVCSQSDLWTREAVATIRPAKNPAHAS